MGRGDQQNMVSLEMSKQQLDTCFRQEVKWSQAFRVGADARLLLLAMHRLLAKSHVPKDQKRFASVYMACRSAAQESYGDFDQAIVDGQSKPLAYAYALPSMPLACVSLAFQMIGATYTLAGPTAGLQVAQMAADAQTQNAQIPTVLAAIASPKTTCTATVDPTMTPPESVPTPNGETSMYRAEVMALMPHEMTKMKEAVRVLETNMATGGVGDPVSQLQALASLISQPSVLKPCLGEV